MDEKGELKIGEGGSATSKETSEVVAMLHGCGCMRGMVIDMNK